LKGTSLLSVSQLCDVGCTATFHKTHVVVDFQGNTILQGQRCPHTNLWTVDIQQPLTAADPGKTPAQMHPQIACNVTLPSTAATLVKFQLTCLFSPVLTTVGHALAASIMPAFPGLTLKALHKHGSPSIHTQKGHMDQTRANQASTSNIEELEHFFPKMLNENKTEHYCFAAITTAPTKTGSANVTFSDQTGKFPFKSQSGNQHLFVFYHYNSNYIHLEPMKNKSQAELLKVYSKTLKMFISAGTKSTLHILDHECPQSLKDYMRAAGVHYQLTPPGTHRCNYPERSIRTAKAHIISGLSSVNPRFPMHQWDQLIPQAEITLNLLRGSRINPKLSAYTQINGIFDPLATPLGPPGCLVLAHKKTIRTTNLGATWKRRLLHWPRSGILPLLSSPHSRNTSHTIRQHSLMVSP